MFWGNPTIRRCRPAGSLSGILLHERGPPSKKRAARRSPRRALPGGKIRPVTGAPGVARHRPSRLISFCHLSSQNTRAFKQKSLSED